MPKEVLNKANEYVLKKELEWCNDKLQEYHDSKRAAEGCMCNQCVSWHNRVIDEMTEETWRLSRVPSMDIDDQRNYELALSKLNLQDDD